MTRVWGSKAVWKKVSYGEYFLMSVKHGIGLLKNMELVFDCDIYDR